MFKLLVVSVFLFKVDFINLVWAQDEVTKSFLDNFCTVPETFAEVIECDKEMGEEASLKIIINCIVWFL